MATELITGQGSTDHINSEDIGAYQARTFGTGCYVLHGCECTIVDSNTVRVAEGELLIEGRHVRVKGSEDLAIRSGAAGYKRNDLIVVSYTKDQDNIEDAPLAVVPGTATEGTASDPSHVQGSILDGDVAAEHPLYRVPIDGLSVGEPVLLMERVVPYTEVWKMLYPVGCVYISYEPTSPASLFGGTWTAIEGRFPYFNAGTGTGGSNTHTNTFGEMATHSHGYKVALNGVQHSYQASAISAEGYDWTNYWQSDQAGTEPIDTNLVEWVGGGASYSIMPAYQTLYAWRRTA